MTIKTRVRDKVCILECGGDLTLGSGEEELRRELKSVVARGEKKIVLDYRGLRFMDSAGVGETVACSKRALERLGIVKILLPEEGVIPRIFEVTGLERAFEIFTDEDLAVASFRR